MIPRRNTETGGHQGRKSEENSDGYGLSGEDRETAQMDSYVEKCRKHPFLPRIGVCPYCLSDRLRLLCPNCASLRPCKCSLSNSENPSFCSSPTSSFDFPNNPPPNTGQSGVTVRTSVFIDSDPTFHRSRSLRFTALPFIRSKSRATNRTTQEIKVENPSEGRRKWSLWSFFAPEKQSKVRNHPMEKSWNTETSKLSRSRSFGVSFHRTPGHLSNNPVSAESAAGEGSATAATPKAKGKARPFSNGMGVSRQPKAVNGRSPICGGRFPPL